MSSDEQLVEYVTEIEEEKVYSLVRKMLDEGRDAKSIISRIFFIKNIKDQFALKKNYFFLQRSYSKNSRILNLDFVNL